jgi:hypothetical protein
MFESQIQSFLPKRAEGWRASCYLGLPHGVLDGISDTSIRSNDNFSLLYMPIPAQRRMPVIALCPAQLNHHFLVSHVTLR